MALLWIGLTAAVSAHSGPPYPIVTQRQVGPYTVSLWTDPDATDDGSAGGQFWVVFHGERRADRVTVSVSAPGDAARTATAAAVDGDTARMFAAVALDHEGPYDVVVRLSGSNGDATLDSRVDATYDLRPPPYLIAVYLLPFVLIGALWVKVLTRRRFTAAPGRRDDT